MKAEFSKLLTEDIIQCREYLAEPNSEEKGRSLYLQITSRYDAVIDNFGNGLYCFYPDQHFYDPDIPISTLNHNLNLLMNKMIAYQAMHSGEILAVIKEEKNIKPIIFISHRTIDKDVADILRDYLIGTGIPSDYIFCSSLPGNDVKKVISKEVKENIKNSSVNIAILSKDYYESAYCINEAGIIWINDTVPAILIGLPEISPMNMYGFLNSDYKLRRLTNMDDISYIYDEVCDAVKAQRATMSTVTAANQKLMERYKELIGKRNQIGKTESVCDTYEVTAKAESNNNTYDITTDDERVILYYILKNKIRKVSKKSLVDYFCKNEIDGINIDNGFDLLSTLGAGRIIDGVLELDIDVFRRYSTNAVTMLGELTPYVEKHIVLSSEKFQELWSRNVIDPYVALFIIYIVEERVSCFGSRWMAAAEVEKIKQWESKNSLDSALSENYDRCLAFFIENKLVYESDWTSYGNPREYTLYTSLQNLLFSNAERYLDDLSATKTAHYFELPF